MSGEAPRRDTENWANKSLRTPWKILQELQKRRPAMMLGELLDKRERAPKQCLKRPDYEARTQLRSGIRRLLDPKGYLCRLRDTASVRNFYLVVEKTLSAAREPARGLAGTVHYRVLIQRPWRRDC